MSIKKSSPFPWLINRTSLLVPKWPPYGPDRATLQIGTEAHKPDGPFAKAIKDDFRKEPIAFLESEEWLKEVYY